LHSIISKLPSTLPGELDFYGRIAGKYRIFRKSSKLPVLIFLRSGIGSANKINIRYIESISNYFKNSIYLKLLRKLEKTPGYYCKVKKPCNPTASLESLQYLSTDKDRLPPSPFKNAFSKNIPTLYITGSVKASLNYINPQPIIYFQRSFNRANQSSNHSLPSGIQPITVHASNLRTGAKAYLDQINPRSVSYLQRNQETEKDLVPKSAYTPLFHQHILKNTRYEDILKEGRVAGKNILISALGEKDRLSKHTDATSIQQNRDLQIINNENILKYGRMDEESIFIPALNLRTEIKAYLSRINPQSAILQSRIQPIHKDRHFRGLSSIRITIKPSTEKDLIPKSANTPLFHQHILKNTRYENILKEGRVAEKYILVSALSLGTGIKSLSEKSINSIFTNVLTFRIGSKAYLSQINPRSASYLQGSFDIENQSLKPSRVAYPLQSRIQHINKEMRFWESLPAKMVIDPSIEKDRISKHTDAASLQKNSNLKIMNDESIFKDGRETVESISIPAPYLRTGAKIVLSSKNPAILSYLQRSVNTYILNTSSKLNKAANFLLSGIQPSDREKRSLKLPFIKTAIWPSTDRAVNSKNVDTPLLQQNTGLKNISYRNTPKEYEITKRGSLIHSFNRLNIINSLQYANPIEKRRASAGLKDLTGGTAYSSTELILKKPVVQKTDIVSEDKEHLHEEKIASTERSDNLIEPFKGRSIYEINTIADKVYKIIERKISIEKDRRGLF